MGINQWIISGNQALTVDIIAQFAFDIVIEPIQLPSAQIVLVILIGCDLSKRNLINHSGIERFVFCIIGQVLDFEGM